MSTTLKAMFNRVIVVRPKAKTETEGGIILPDAVQEKDRPTKGVVISVGPFRNQLTGEIHENNYIKSGDIVVFSKYAGSDHAVGDVNVSILGIDEILAIEADTD